MKQRAGTSANNSNTDNDRNSSDDSNNTHNDNYNNDATSSNNNYTTGVIMIIMNKRAGTSVGLRRIYVFQTVCSNIMFTTFNKFGFLALETILLKLVKQEMQAPQAASAALQASNVVFRIKYYKH